jgi:hypothetical protein
MVISAVGVFLPPVLAAALLAFAGVSAALAAAMVRPFLTWFWCSEGALEVRASEREAEDDTGGVPGSDKAETGEDTAGSSGASKSEKDGACGPPGFSEGDAAGPLGASKVVEEDNAGGMLGEEETAEFVGKAGAMDWWRGAGIVYQR